MLMSKILIEFLMRGEIHMTRCTNCQIKWKLKDVIKLSLSKDGRNCPQCGERQYVSKDAQNFMTLSWLSLLFLPLIIYRITLSSKKEHLFD